MAALIIRSAPEIHLAPTSRLSVDSSNSPTNEHRECQIAATRQIANTVQLYFSHYSLINNKYYYLFYFKTCVLFQEYNIGDECKCAVRVNEKNSEEFSTTIFARAEGFEWQMLKI